MPLSLTKEPDSDIKASKVERQDEPTMYSDNDNDEKEVTFILLSDDVPPPQLEVEPVSFDCEDSPTLPPTNIFIELNELDGGDDKTFEEEKQPETDLLLDLRSETEVDSLEVSLHEIQDPILSLETTGNKEVLKNEETTMRLLLNEAADEEKCKEEEEEEKKSIIVKRRSTHSLIPRKQNLHPTEQPVVIQKPLSPSQSTFNINRRGSSGSFIPIPQQNRLSFTMTESKHWSPSSSSDSLSLRSSASSSDSITTTEKNKSHTTRLPNPSSKIPVFATKPSELQKVVVPSINNMSRLPVKRTPTTAI